MKKCFIIFAGLTALALVITGCRPAVYSQPAYAYNYDGYYGDGYYTEPTAIVVNQPSLNFNDFYIQLSPYGTWIHLEPYGQVWIANVPSFQPYSTNGYWVSTTYGWTWVSNYPWGWAPFHYGRWGYNNRYGWYWVPGYIWGPAWVAWSSSADMYGWAPLMPGMHFNVNISVNHFPSSYWTFMPGRYMGNTNIGNYYVNRSKNVTIIKNTTIINNYGTENNGRYSRGPNNNDVQRYTGRSVQPMRVSNVNDSRGAGVISNNELRVYRPVASSESTSGRSSNTFDNNNRTTTPQTRTQSDQPATRTSTPQTRTQSDQQSTRTSTPQTRTQSDQQSTRTSTPQTRTQSDQQSTRTSTPQTRAQTNQPAARQSASSSSSEYRQNPAQPAVTNKAAPQTRKQIDTAEKDNSRQQRSTTTQSGRR